MSFKVAARTVLELGSELISSDAIALYELIKNAIDAESDSGVEIDFVVTLSAKNYRDLLAQFNEAEDESFDEWAERIAKALESDALDEHVDTVRTMVDEAEDWDEIEGAIEHAYNDLSYIEIRDTGCGMSLADLREAFLTIGTPRRYKVLKQAMDENDTSRSPVLGEKGVGRLSAMRLGDTLEVETATAGGKYINRLSIDWTRFAENLDQLIQDVPVEPERGQRKPDSEQHGTVIRVRRLTASWSRGKLENLANKQLARITDPFDTQTRRFGIYLSYNGDAIDFVRFVRKTLFKEAHARLRGEYRVSASGDPELVLTLSAPLFGRAEQTETYDKANLVSIAGETLDQIATEALFDLGPFKFDLYWFNRQRLKKPAGFESRREFLDLVKSWSGIMLYRDGYQVLPYGDEDTDWLELDRKALGAGGYKLNKAQFVGRVSISRIANPDLVDQTNREGLRDCDEKRALIGLLQFAVQDRLKGFLEESERAEKRADEVADDPKQRKREVKELNRRTRDTLKQVEPKDKEDRVLLKQVFEMYAEFESKYRAIELALEAAKDEHERLVDLAGVGLIIESLAHELTRTVEYSATVLNQQKKQGLPPEVRDFYSTLKASMASIEKRLKIIDPLSPSGRQRRTDRDLRKIIDAVVATHEAQFNRHNIKVRVKPEKAKPLPVFAVEGRIIQIVENLISNSVYWIKAQRKAQRQDASKFPESITIELTEKPVPTIRFSDSGPGIPLERKDQVFAPFFSTKPSSTRQGLGLYIARECAEFHGGSIELDVDEVNEHGNLATFMVEIPDTRER
ncbi:MAG: sensor histidine kinase [Pseudomonadota bacterium]